MFSFEILAKEEKAFMESLTDQIRTACNLNPSMEEV